MPPRTPFASFLPRLLRARLARLGAAELAGHFEPVEGASVFVDVSGFTPLSEKLATLGREGAEELTRILNGFYDALIVPIEASGGDVMAFAGDAMSVFFPAGDEGLDEAVRRAAACALALQEVARPFETVATRAGEATLRIKVGLAAGTAKIGAVGAPEVGYRPLFAGGPVDAAAAAEHHCRPGDVFADESARVPGLRFVRDGLLGSVDGRHRADLPVDDGGGEADPDDLSRFLPAPLAARIAETGDRGLGEHRRCAVLFLKFLGIDEADPDADARVQRFFLAASRVVGELEGTVNKIDTGDKGAKLLVLFGAPVAHEDDPRRAALAALRLVETGAAQQPPLDVRIGLHAGRIFAGVVGSPRRREYTAMGDAVNVAARLMERGGERQVIASASLAAQLPPGFAFAPFEPVMFKGKSEPISVAPLLAFEGTEGAGASQVVGRDTDLARLAGWLAGRDPAGALVALTGPAGVGKSALAAALLAAPPLAGRTVLRAEAQEHTRREPYAPWKRPLEQVIERLGGAAEARGWLADVDPGLAPWLGLLDEFAGRPADPVVPPVDPETRRSLLWRTIGLLLGEAARREPLALLLDNLQWADDPSLELLRHLRLEGTALPAWVAVSRTAVDLGGREGEDTLVAEVSPLDRAGTAALLALATSAREVPAELADRLHGISGGNPLFALELLAALVAAKAVEHDPEDPGLVWYHAHRASELPGSLEALFLSRFDHLPPSQREFLRRAAVFGDRIPIADAPNLLPDGSREEPLATWLAGQEMLKVDGDALAFTRSLEREVIYQSIDFASRRELHRLIGELLDRSMAADDPARADRLAHHFFHSDAPVRAVPHLEEAAGRARRAFSNKAAAEGYERLLTLLGSDPTTTARGEAIRLALAELWTSLGEAATAKAHAGVVAEGDASSPAGRAQAVFLLGDLDRIAGAAEAARATLARARELADAAGRDDLAFAAEAALGRVAAQSGDMAGAKAILEGALAKWKKQRASGPGLLARMTLAMIRARMGEGEVALDLLGKVAREAGKRGELATQFKSLTNRALCAFYLERYRMCRRDGEVALRIGERCGFALHLPPILTTLGLLRTGEGAFPEAEIFFERSLSQFRRMGDPAQAAALDNLGYVSFLQGQYGAAIQRFEQARRAAVEMNNPLNLQDAWLDLSWLLFEFGDPILAEIFRPAWPPEASGLESTAAAQLIQALLDAANRSLGSESLPRLEATLGSNADPRDLLRFRIIASRACSAAQEHEEAARHRKEAESVASRVNDRYLRVRCLALRLESARRGGERPSDHEIESEVRSSLYPDLRWRLIRAWGRRLSDEGDTQRGADLLRRARSNARILAARERDPEVARAWRRRIERLFPDG